MSAKLGAYILFHRSDIPMRWPSAEIRGTSRLTAKLLYGGGLRLMECLRLRVKDLDFAQGQIIVRDGKGMEDRVTMLPESLIIPLQEH